MYDFLDKIGLKAVLEAVKGKIPSSLPANGGNADTAKTLSDFLGVWQENLDDAPLGFCCAHGGTVNTPFGFWSTVITVGQNGNYRQQIAFPWAEGESYIMPKFRVMDNGVWYSWKTCGELKPYIVSGATVKAGESTVITNHNFMPSAVFWWENKSSVYPATSFDTTSFNMAIASSIDRTINCIIFK